jgi:ribulose-5-phosphate 4-epimerase/fuculose-1-phosphate aldolase
MTETVELRRRVAEACRVIGVLGLTSGTVGHASARAPDSGRWKSISIPSSTGSVPT